MDMEIRELGNFMGFIDLLVSNVTKCEVVFDKEFEDDKQVRIKYIALSDDYSYCKFMKKVVNFFKYDAKCNVNIYNVQFCMDRSLIIRIYY